MKTQLNNFRIKLILALILQVAFAVLLFNSLNAQIIQVGTTQKAYSTSNSISLTKPTGVAIGDILIANIVKYASANTTAPSMAGWTVISSGLGGNSNRIGAVLYKVVDGTEPSSFTFALGSSTAAEGAIIAYTNVDLTNPFDVQPGTITAATGTGTTVSPAGISTVTPGALVIMLSMSYSTLTTARTFNSWTATFPATLTELYDAAGTSYVSVAAATSTKNTAGTTGNGTITVSGTSYLGGIILALKPKKQFQSIASGNWNSTSTWQQSTDGGTTWISATTTPSNKDGLVTITSGNTVTLSVAATASSVTVNGKLDVNTYTLTGTGTILVSNGGTLTIGGTANFPTGFSTKTLSTGSTVEYDGAGQTINPINYSNLTLSGNGTPTMTGVTTVSGNLIVNGTVTATPVITTVGGNVSINGTSRFTTGAGLTIAGNLTIGDGASFTAAGYNLTVTGNTNIGGGTNGTLTISSSTGTKIFTGSVTVNNGAIWSNTSSPITCRGGITNNGTFTAGSGVYTFDTNAQSLSGTISIPSVTITTITVTNNNSLTIGTAVTGSGNLTQAANAVLNIGGTSLITTLTATNTGNTVAYSGSAQTIHDNVYYNLSLSGSGNKTIGGSISINNNLSISGTAIALLTSGKTFTSITLTLGGVNQSTGAWGGTGSAAANKNVTWFGSSTTGLLNVNISCTAGTWLGNFSTNWNDAGNWCGGIPAAGANITISAGTLFQPVIGAATVCNNITINSGAVLTISGTNTLTVTGNWANNGGSFNENSGTIIFSGTNQSISNETFYNLSLTNSGTKSAGTITVSGILNIASGVTLNMQTNVLSGSMTTTGTGTLQTQNISSTPLPDGATWNFSVNYNAISGGQTIVTGTYNNLSTSNSSGIQTAAGNLIVNNTFTTTSGGTINLGTNTLSVNTVSHSGILQTQNTGTTPITSGKTWGGTVTYNGGSGGQTIAAGTYNNLTSGSTSGTQSAGGDLIVNGKLTIGSSILDLLTYQLSGSLTSIISSGEIRTANMSAQPVPNGKTWGGIFTYYGGTPSATQTVVTGTYKLGQTGMAIANGNYAPNGDINIYDSAGCRFDNGGGSNVSSILDMGDIYTFKRLGTGLGKVTNNGATIRFKGATNGIAGFTSGTVEYAGIVDQTIAGDATNYTYGFLTLSGSGKKSLNADIWVKRDWVRNGKATFDPGTHKVVFQGDNNDNYNAVITAPASSERNKYGAFGGEVFYDLEINKNSSSMTVSNSTGVNISVLHSLAITKGVLNVGDSNIVLVSNASNTASLNQINSSNASINYSSTGRFIVQRYIDNKTSTIRTWRMLSAPLQSTETETISQAWQENTECNNYTIPNSFDPWSGYGTQITGPKTYTAGNGFDQGSGSSTYSIKYYDAATGTWGYPSNTNNTTLMSKTGWALFVRGDRSFGIANQYTTPTNTVLEPKGKINTGDVTVNVVKGKFNLIGNPYPAEINMANVSIGGNSHGWFELWDPKAFSNYSKTGKYIPFVWNADGYYTFSNSPVTSWNPGTVESGVAIFVNPSGSQIIFHESDKVNGANSLLGIQSRPTGTSSSIRCDLAFYDTASAAYSYIDGTLNLYHPSYNTSVDQFEDVISTISSSTTGALRIAKSGIQLSISKEQPLLDNDTIYLNISKLMQMRHRIAFSVKNFDGRIIEAYAVDNYLGTSTPITLNDTDSTFLDFTITADPLSNSTNRFMIVFKSNMNIPLAVNFTGINALQQQNKISVQWNVANESGVKKYEIERSADGINFIKIGETKTSIHNWIDADPQQGNNYYRIKSIDVSGEQKYSGIAKVVSGRVTPSIELLNNPVKNNLINLQFNNQSKGLYAVRLINETGQQLQTTKLSYEGGNGSQSISVSSTLPKGIYQLELITPSNDRVIKKVLIN